MSCKGEEVTQNGLPEGVDDLVCQHREAASRCKKMRFYSWLNGSALRTLICIDIYMPYKSHRLNLHRLGSASGPR